MFTVSCTLQTVTTPPVSVSTVAVFPPHTRAGDPLLVTGSSWLRSSVLRVQPVTVADMLAKTFFYGYRAANGGSNDKRSDTH
jgi:hypothetical protein